MVPVNPMICPCLQAAKKEAPLKKKAPPPPKDVEEDSSEEDSDDEEEEVRTWLTLQQLLYLQHDS